MGAVRADDHCLLHHSRLLPTEALVVLDHVGRELLQAVGITQQHLHRAHGALALLDGVLGRPFLGATVVVFLDLPRFVFGEEHSRQPWLVGDAHGDSVVTRLFHCVAVHNGTEHGDRLVDGRAGKAHVGRVGEAVA